MTDHEIAALVTRLTRIAVVYHASQSLRQRISNEVVRAVHSARTYGGLQEKRMPSNRLSQKFNEYLNAALSSEPPPVVKKALQDAFMAGVISFTALVGRKDLTEEQLTEVAEDIDKEVNLYIRRLELEALLEKLTRVVDYPSKEQVKS